MKENMIFKYSFKHIFCISVILLFMIFSSLSISANQEMSDSTDNGELFSAYKFKNVVVDVKFCGFSYSDAMIFLNNQSFNPDIAKISACLSNAVYDNGKIINALKEMGFKEENIVTYNFDGKIHGKLHTLDDNDWVRYVIATKKVFLPGEDIPYVFYCVPVEGTSGSYDWCSDFNIGTGDNHEGFYKAHLEILNSLKNTMDADESDKEHRIIWTMGHSRGAAVANIVSGELTEGYYGFSQLILPKHVFCYTIACPNVSRNANPSLKNIYCFNSQDDTVPLLPFDDWGFKRYGQVISLSSDNRLNLNERFNQVFSTDYAGNDEIPTQLSNIILSVIPNTGKIDSIGATTLLKGLGYLFAHMDSGNLQLNELFSYIGVNIGDKVLDKIQRYYQSKLSSMTTSRAEEIADIINHYEYVFGRINLNSLPSL